MGKNGGQVTSERRDGKTDGKNSVSKREDRYGEVVERLTEGGMD